MGFEQKRRASPRGHGGNHADQGDGCVDCRNSMRGKRCICRDPPSGRHGMQPYEVYAAQRLLR